MRQRAGCRSLLAGLYFAFSTFITTSLGRIEQAAGISAMNAINVDILRSLFMPFFLGTTLACAVRSVLGCLRWQEPGAIVMVCGGLFYVVGLFAVRSGQSCASAAIWFFASREGFVIRWRLANGCFAYSSVAQR
ncbi:hypothetical protein [Bradyrhizobium lablabi]|uniref:hypothetical protein n=1 Tax=Bradyrhizobium lablabi TaxID=722472 RepID=UPI0020138284|nr:hypothetical protein [Bradyrhizobium lablabi]